MNLSINSIKDFARCKEANSRVATRSVYRPEDRRQNVDTVLYTKPQQNTKVSQGLFTFKKDLHAGLYRASDRRAELAENSVTPTFKPMDAAVGDTAAASLANTNTATASSTNSNGAGDATASSSVALSVSSPTAVALPGGVGGSPQSSFRSLQTLQPRRKGVEMPGIKRCVAQTSPDMRCGVETPFNGQLKQETSETETKKADMAVLRDSPPKSKPVQVQEAISSQSSQSVSKASSSRPTNPTAKRISEEQKQEPEVYVRFAYKVCSDKDNYVKVQLLRIPVKREDLVLKASELYSDSSPPPRCFDFRNSNQLRARRLAMFQSVSTRGPGANTRDVSTNVRNRERQLSSRYRGARPKASTSASASASRQQSANHSSPWVIEPKASTSASAFRGQNDSQHLSVNASVLSNRGGFLAPSSPFSNPAFSILPVVLCLLGLFFF